MSKKLIYLFCFVLVLSIVGNASADLLVHWRLDEGSGTTAFDSSGNGNDGTFTGEPQWVDGHGGGGALEFDGVDDFVVYSFDQAQTFAAFSVAFWVKASSLGQPNYASPFTGYYPNTAGFQIDVNGGNPGEYRVNPSGLIFGTATTDWVHLALTAEGTSAKLYYNGEWVLDGNLNDSTFNQFAIGVNRNRNWWFAGTIDELRVYDHVLSEAEILGAMEGEIWPYAFGAEPADGTLHEATWANVSWKPGGFAVSHDVYIGENFDDVNDGAEGTFLGNQATTKLIVGFPGMPYPDGLVPGTTYYWRIDEVNDTEPNSPWKGNVWSFTVPPRTAYNPEPADGVKFEFTDVELGWTAGFAAKLHYVYFGDNFDDVNSAVVGLPQTETTYTPGTLELDKDYYWRIDEFDGVATNKGDVWSFRTIPVIPMTDDPTLVGWWTLDEGIGTNAVDWSGYGRHGTFVGAPQWADGYHGAALEFSATGQYVDCGADAGQEVTGDFTIAAWVKLAPNNAGHYGGIAGKLTRLGGTDYMGFAIVRYSSNVFRLWVSDGNPDAIAGQASSDLTYTDTGWHHVAGVREGQINALYVDGVKQSETSVTDFVPSEEFFHIGRQYSHLDDRYFRGLIDDVRVYNQALNQEGIQLVMRGDPLLAWGPSPSPASTLYIREATPLSWSPGDSASGHDVYFGTDRDAVVDADTSDTTGIYRGRQGVTIYTPPDVEWGGGPYYWRIDEYNTDATMSKGNVWSFTVTDFIGIDDFEDYNDYPPDEIFNTWIDGFGTTTNGALIAHDDPPFAETTVVHGGGQSMPYRYDNNFKYSEATMTLVWPRDWTEEGVGVLSLWFYGDSTNAAERMYIALNGIATVYHDNPDAALINTWTEWRIDLQESAAQGVNLTNVNTISIGFGDKSNLQAGGLGLVFFDDIRLYRPLP
jgi:hypothetical protein